MAVVFVLGPSQWKLTSQGPTPFEVREELVAILERYGHQGFMMERLPDSDGESLAAKFLRILEENGVTHILVYWPLGAKMPTTIAELVALRFRREERATPEIFLLLEDGVASFADRFEVNVEEAKVAYLRDIVREGVTVFPWADDERLFQLVATLAQADFDI